MLVLVFMLLLVLVREQCCGCGVGFHSGPGGVAVVYAGWGELFLYGDLVGRWELCWS